jgi:ProP effector
MGFEQLAALKAQQNQETKSTKGASRATSTCVDARGEIKPRSKRPRTSADDAAHAVVTLQKRFPRAFPRSPIPKVPLKVGILNDVLAHAVSIGLSAGDVRNGIKLRCRGNHYWTRLTEGNAPIDLHGG